MKKVTLKLTIALLAILTWGTNLTQAQVKIGNNPTTIDNSSLLELESIDKALVLTRVTNAEMNAIVSPLEGALVYNTDLNCIHQYKNVGGTNLAWRTMCTPNLLVEATITGADLTATQTPAIATVPFNTTSVNIDNVWNTSTYVFTAPYRGTFLFEASVGQRICNGNYFYRLGISKPNQNKPGGNNVLSKFAQVTHQAGCSYPGLINVSESQFLSAGDVVFIQQRFMNAPFDLSPWNYDNSVLNNLKVWYIGD